MIVLGLLVGLFALACFVFAFVDLRAVDRPYRAGRPGAAAAREPSAGVYLALRVALAGMAVISAWYAVDTFGRAVSRTGPDHGEIVERMKAAAEELASGGPQLKSLDADGAWSSYVQHEVRRPGESERPVLVSTTGNTERYELDGVCLTVTAEAVPGQPAPKYAHIDDRRYNLKAEVMDSACNR